MGMYIDLKVDIRLKPDTPEDVKTLLLALMTSELDIDDIKKPRHVFWHTPRFDFVGCTSWLEPNDCAGYEFPNLKIRSCIKNHDQVFQKFLQWILPSIESIEGVYHYEEQTRPSDIALIKDPSNTSMPALQITHYHNYRNYRNSSFGYEDDEPNIYTETICLTG